MEAVGQDHLQSDPTRLSREQFLSALSMRLDLIESSLVDLEANGAPPARRAHLRRRLQALADVSGILGLDEMRQTFTRGMSRLSEPELDFTALRQDLARVHEQFGALVQQEAREASSSAHFAEDAQPAAEAKDELTDPRLPDWLASATPEPACIDLTQAIWGGLSGTSMSASPRTVTQGSRPEPTHRQPRTDGESAPENRGAQPRPPRSIGPSLARWRELAAQLAAQGRVAWTRLPKPLRMRPSSIPTRALMSPRWTHLARSCANVALPAGAVLGAGTLVFLGVTSVVHGGIPRDPTAGVAAQTAAIATSVMQPAAPGVAPDLETVDMALPSGLVLTPDQGLLEINTSGRHKIYVSGVFIGRGPVRRVPLRAGVHEVRTALDDSQRTYMVTVTPGRRTALQPALSASR